MTPFSLNIPPEILTQIFQWIYLVAVNNPRGQPVDGKHVRRLCWPVSQVCKYWRDVALAAPFLWTYLPTINLDDDELPSPNQQFEFLKALIPRTRNHTLHISAVGATETDFDKCLEVVDYITEYSERWESLSVRASPDYLEEYFGDISGRLPRLEMLTLALLDGDGAELTLFEDAPNLKFVHITGQPAGFLNLDTQALLHLYDDTAILTHNLQPTHGFPQLRTLEVFDTGDGFDYSQLSYDEDVVLFPALRTLHYTSSDDFPGGEFFMFVIAPVLEDLSVVAYDGDITGYLVDLHIRSGSPPLKHLRLRLAMDDLPEQAFPDLLKLLPQLESLAIDLPPVSNISSLAVCQGLDVLVPQLRKCIFISSGEVIQDDVGHAIAGMAEARCRRPQLQPSNSDTSTSADSTTDKDDAAVWMQLYLQQNLLWYEDRPWSAGFGRPLYTNPKIFPIKLESWYQPQNGASDTNSDDEQDVSKRRRSSRIRQKQRGIQESVYAKVVSEIPNLVSPADQEFNSESANYKRTLELIAKLEKKYKSEHLVNFLVANTSPCLIYLAYTLKTRLPGHDHERDGNSLYGRVVRFLRRVKSDLLQRLDEFHWIWVMDPDAYVLKYIHDGHELRADRDKFAEAVLGLSDDLWLLEDL
ncbi:hypothetical protein D9619_011546 [Psilocybe cf. subviscida]|uniref:F-box domain-containing protein n=1 Tax=Psilocybe cf. subviscida TaxID=2480587 RepID=A0A8H5F9K4_9AGAR|nr:hypothetical protein D9619_011546 [Psilocybe cf. subviscida]